MRQKKRCDVVHRKGRFDSIDGLGPFEKNRRRIVHEHMKRLVSSEKFRRDRANLLLGRKIRQEKFQPTRSRRCTTQVQGGLPALGIPAEQPKIRATRGEGPCGGQPDARTRARNQHVPALNRPRTSPAVGRGGSHLASCHSAVLRSRSMKEVS